MKNREFADMELEQFLMRVAFTLNINIEQLIGLLRTNQCIDLQNTYDKHRDKK
jgi:hypothetical protein